MRLTAVLCRSLAALLLATSASAATVISSDVVSEPALDYLGTPLVDLLDATIMFDVVDGTDADCNFADCLKITLTNDTDTNVPTFLADINALGFSVTTDVTFLTPDVLPANWQLDTSTGQGGPTHLDGMGIHDYALSTTASGGPNFNPVMPGASYVFTFGTDAGLDMSDFVVLSEQPPGGGNILTVATLKFVRFRNGPDTELDITDLCDDGDPLTPVCDSGFGGVALPEPTVGMLYGAGLLGLAWAGRRRQA